MAASDYSDELFELMASAGGQSPARRTIKLRMAACHQQRLGLRPTNAYVELVICSWRNTTTSRQRCAATRRRCKWRPQINAASLPIAIPGY
jgi:hypothetical protein